MKKILIITVALLFIFPGAAQLKQAERKSSFLISAGVSVPVACYASKNLRNEEAGFADLGFTISLIYEFSFITNAGVTGKAFYSFNPVDKKIKGEGQAFPLNNYRYYGLMIGPYFKHTLAGNTDVIIKFMPGILRVNSPTLSHDQNAVASSNGAYAFAWSAGADFRYHFNGTNHFLLLNGDFTSSKPHLKVPALGENVKIEQHIAVVNGNAGMGFRF